MHKLGLTTKQSRVYLALLNLGDGSVADIAKESKLPRTTLYTIIQELEQLSLVLRSLSGKKTRFVPQSPQEFLKSFRNHVEEFASATEELRAVSRLSAHIPRISFFKGPEGFRKTWDVVFKSSIKEYCILTDPREMLGFVSESYITHHLVQEKKRRALKSRQLIASSEYAKRIVAKDAQENRVSKILPHIYPVPVTIIIFGKRVAFISPRDENTILLIESEAFAKTHQSIFDSLWVSVN